ncbi:MAG: UDP-3-O-(3-hydroxymyristoyl)glucosamine N-acyltransferase [Planctomycetes bacterium]|nr:UDP-3-O-(3-hydroxymyristoyl)glucosamine N-acyltransferase [Planctomycetota bacterium]
MKAVKLEELAELVNGKLIGDAEVTVNGLCPIHQGFEGAITFCASKEYLSEINNTKASAVIVNREFELALKNKPGIVVESADYAFAVVAEHIAADYPPRQPAIHKTASVSENAKIGENVFIGANAVIDDYAEIGNNTVIEAQSYVGYKSKIGENCHVYQNVVIREHSIIGNRVIFQPGVKIGSDGFGYAFIKGEFKKIPQLGNVIIEDDVEIGANTCIDRARFENTIIRKGVKIDNLSQIAHNVQIGENSVVSALVGLSGTVKIGKNCLIGGQAGATDHITLGDNIRVYPQSGLIKDYGSNQDIGGSPAQTARKFRRHLAILKFLPDMHKDIRSLKNRIDEISRNTGIGSDLE